MFHGTQLPPLMHTGAPSCVGRDLQRVAGIRVVEIVVIRLERGHIVVRCVQIIVPAVDDVAVGTDHKRKLLCS